MLVSHCCWNGHAADRTNKGRLFFCVETWRALLPHQTMSGKLHLRAGRPPLKALMGQSNFIGYQPIASNYRRSCTLLRSVFPCGAAFLLDVASIGPRFFTPYPVHGRPSSLLFTRTVFLEPFLTCAAANLLWIVSCLLSSDLPPGLRRSTLALFECRWRC